LPHKTETNAVERFSAAMLAAPLSGNVCRVAGAETTIAADHCATTRLERVKDTIFPAAASPGISLSNQALSCPRERAFAGSEPVQKIRITTPPMTQSRRRSAIDPSRVTAFQR